MIKFPLTYRAFAVNIVGNEAYSLLPIRYEDRHSILKWRNEQIFHLRQAQELSEKDQETYFLDVVLPLFKEKEPKQFLFSFFKDDRLVGYGGLVHMNWIDRNAEVSFVMETSLEKDLFEELWENYLKLLKVYAFKHLNLHKIFTYAFDLRPRLYRPLQNSEFIEEARLRNHCFFKGKYYDVLLHSCFNPNH